MKRWIALLTALCMLCACALAGAEEETDPEKLLEDLMDIVEIEESMVTEENERMTAGTLGENLQFILKLLQREDVQELMRIQDVRDVLREVVYRAGAWLWENRGVTMKILTELGVEEQERTVISRIWDSAERIVNAEKECMQTEDGKLLLQEIEELKKDPACTRVIEDFLNLVQAKDVQTILKAMETTRGDIQDETTDMFMISAGDVIKNTEKAGGEINEADAEQIAWILNVIRRCSWAADGLQDLMRTEIFWKVVSHFFSSQFTLYNETILPEIRELTRDPAIADYLYRLAETMAAFANEVRQQTDHQTSGNVQATEEEAAP